MIRRILALVCVAVAFGGCDNGPSAPTTPVDKATCSAGDKNGTVICIDGNGNTVIVNQPTPSPSPSPSPAKAECAKLFALYQENVVLASRDLRADQSQAAYISALATEIRKAGFQVTAGGLLSPDEIAVKVSNTFSETYDVWRADNTPQVLYIETCTPARF